MCGDGVVPLGYLYHSGDNMLVTQASASSGGMQCGLTCDNPGSVSMHWTYYGCHCVVGTSYYTVYGPAYYTTITPATCTLSTWTVTLARSISTQCQ